jgi:coproporphyrinogen III oxidase
MDRPNAIAVRACLMGLQDRIYAALEAQEGRARFREDRFEDPSSGLACPRGGSEADST